MKHCIRSVSFFAFVLLSGIVFCSCQSTGVLSTITHIGGQLAAATGLIDRQTADSISKAGTAIDSAIQIITPQQEYYIGRAVAATLLTSYKPYSNADLQKYLNEICAAIIINSPKPELYKGYYVQVLDSKEINAFATSGGHILVTRGLLECADSEDAAAAVIAHEIAHIQLQHGIKAIRASRTTAAITATAQAGFSASGVKELKNLASAFDLGISEVLSTMINSGYSQSQEFDADAEALSLLQSAGYSPQAMSNMLELLRQKETGTQTGFFKTHPKPADRIAQVEIELAAYNLTALDKTRNARFINTKNLF